ncbi:MAG: hypothetical protein ACQGVC_09430 [Myxococcota bacterium]
MNGLDSGQLAGLEASVEADPGAHAFPALAELHRRGGRLQEAERVAREGLARKPERVEGRLVLALVLLDQGRDADARDQLEGLTPAMLAAAGVTAPEHAAVLDADDSLSEGELEAAFQQAETDAEQLITPDRVAAEAVAHVDAGAADGYEEAAAEPVGVESGSAFVTASMAELLERQGDESGAERIRAALASSAPAPVAPSVDEAKAPSRRQKQIATLERWLANIRGDRS